MADYISREAAKEFFLNMDAGSRCPSSTLLTSEEFAEYLDEIPAADVEPVRQRWIPLAGRIPEGECIAFSAQGEMLVGWIDVNEASDTGYICENDGLYLYDVTHWMPLLEPPEEGGEGNAAL